MKHPNPNPVTHYPISSHYYLSSQTCISLLSSFNHLSKTQTLASLLFQSPLKDSHSQSLCLLPSDDDPLRRRTSSAPHRPRCSTPTLTTSSLLNADAHHHLAAQRQRRTSPPPPLTTTHHHLAVTQIQTSSQSKRCVSCFDVQICNILLVFFCINLIYGFFLG